MAKRRLQAVPPSAEQPQSHTDVMPPAPQLLLTEEAADLLRFIGPRKGQLFFQWANRWNVPRLHRGRTLLWERRVLLEFVARKRWTRRRADAKSA